MRMRIAFAMRVHNARVRSAVATGCDNMSAMDTLRKRIADAATKRAQAEDAFKAADEELRQLLIEGRAAGLGPSEMGRLTGFTREWVAKIAPAPPRS